MPANGLIVIARLKPDRAAGLRDLLDAIGNDLRGVKRPAGSSAPLIDFSRSETIHFARLVVLDDLPDRSEGPRLLLATDYDGDLAAHLSELSSLSPDADALWGSCYDYRGPDSFQKFIVANQVQAEATYVAFPGETVAALRRRLRDDDLLQASYAAPLVVIAKSGAAASPSVAALASALLRGATRAAGAALDLVSTGVRQGPFEVLGAARAINASLDRIGWIRLFNLLTLNEVPTAAPIWSSLPVDSGLPCRAAVIGDEIVSWSRGQTTAPPLEDEVAQNQLTLITRVRPECLPRLKAVLAMIDIYARRLSAPGDLLGISTIHTVRWALIDGGRRLLMSSNYDGSWENYIDEFAEMVASGLDAIWGCCFGMPEDGARDLPAFKRFLRCHQAAASIFYSAYPSATVLRLRDLIEEVGAGSATARA